jgi:hypothetical protein
MPLMSLQGLISIRPDMVFKNLKEYAKANQLRVPHQV